MVTDTRSSTPLLPLLPVAYLLLLGCATPAPIVRLDPRGANGVVWVGGRASVAQEQAGIRVATAFEHQDGNALGLRLEIQNGTERALEVSPRGVTFMVCTAPGTESCSPSYPVIDPEAVLTALQEKQSRETAAAINDQRFYTSMVLLSAAGDIASIANGRGNHTTGLQTAAVANAAHNSGEQYNSEMQSIGVQRQIWSNEAFRRNTLAPGGGVGGLIYMPIALNARYLWMHVRVGGRVFPFGFQQTVRHLTPPRPVERPQ
jgi:hypothetical protein